MTTPPDEIEALIEAAAGSWRPRDADGQAREHPAWHDLDAEGRALAFEAAATSRRLEAALDPQGLSSTAKVVLARIRGVR
jgi:hypothetical protein